MGNTRKKLATCTKEFFSLWRYYSFLYAFYNFIWWLCFYTRPPFCYKLSTYVIKKKTAWLDNYIEKEYKQIIDKYKENTYSCETYCHTTEPRIWVFWGQGEENMPPLVKACYQQLTHYNKNVMLVTNENVNRYITLPNIIIDKVNTGKISWAYYSDIIRNTLLAQYGGLWLDATVWVAGELPIEELKDYRFFSPAENLQANSKSVRFYSTFEYNWNGWCLWSNVKGFPIFSLVSKMLIEIAIKEQIIPDYVTIDYLIYYAIRNIPATHNDIEKAKTFKCGKRHKLATIMNEAWSEERYQELLKEDYFFKLSFRANWKENTESGEPTFYGTLISPRKHTTQKANN